MVLRKNRFLISLVLFVSYLIRLLDEWGKEVEEMPETERRTAKGKSVLATYKQCARYLDPLFKMCKKKVCIYLQ